MAVFRWGHPWFAFQDLEQEVDRLLRSVNLFQGLRAGRQYPALNLYETDDAFLITAELPGADPNEIEITLNAGILTLRGDRRDETDIPEDRFRRAERYRGPWQRTVALPDRIDQEGLSAGVRHGVLTVTLPKAPSTPARQIPVSDDRSASGSDSDVSASDLSDPNLDKGEDQP